MYSSNNFMLFNITNANSITLENINQVDNRESDSLSKLFNRNK